MSCVKFKPMFCYVLQSPFFRENDVKGDYDPVLGLRSKGVCGEHLLSNRSCSGTGGGHVELGRRIVVLANIHTYCPYVVV
jgi:hypothetical protein